LLLEKKAEMKKRLGKSPDIADALALTFAAPVAPALRHGRNPNQVAHEYDPYRVAHDYDPYRTEAP
jgi:hypothetical protein